MQDLVLTREDWPSTAVVVDRNLSIQSLSHSSHSRRLLNFTDLEDAVHVQPRITLTLQGLAISGLNRGVSIKGAALKSLRKRRCLCF